MTTKNLLPVCALLCIISPVAFGEGLDPYLITLLDVQPDEKLRLEREIDAERLQIASVIKYPESSRYNHLGWPVATSTQNGTVVLAYKRSISHGSDGSSSWEGRYITRSTNLLDWNPLSPARRRGRIGVLRGMHALAAPAGEIDTRVVLLADRSCYLSNDSGETWTDNSASLPDLGQAVHIGPNLVMHSKFGLLGFYGQEQGSSRRNWIVSSHDQGTTWRSHSWQNQMNARGVEPAAAGFGEGHVVLISRERKAYGTSDGRYLCNTQHLYRHTPGATFDSVQFDTKRTNIRYNEALGVDSADRCLPRFIIGLHHLANDWAEGCRGFTASRPSEYIQVRLVQQESLDGNKTARSIEFRDFCGCWLEPLMLTSRWKRFIIKGPGTQDDLVS